MKKLIERFARFLLRKCGVPAAEIRIGVPFICEGEIWVVHAATTKKEFAPYRASLTIEGWNYGRYTE